MNFETANTVFNVFLDLDDKPGVKEQCITFNNTIISCESGICRNVSSVYACDYRSKLDDIIEDEDFRGHCNCAMCQATQPINENQEQSSKCMEK